MASRLVGALLVILLAATAEAGLLDGLFGKKNNGDKTPKPIDMVKTRSDFDHKVDRKALHSRKYDKANWGTQWKQIFRDDRGGRDHPNMRP